MSKNDHRGFTLIELLVVVAIIGVLASIVMVSLNSARNKGKNASIKSQMAELRAAAELYNDDMASYTGWCSDSQNTRISGGAVSAGGTAYACNDSASAWAAGITMVDGTFWCVDSNGTSKAAHKVAGATSCP